MGKKVHKIVTLRKGSLKKVVKILSLILKKTETVFRLVDLDQGELLNHLEVGPVLHFKNPREIVIQPNSLLSSLKNTFPILLRSNLLVGNNCWTCS